MTEDATILGDIQGLRSPLYVTGHDIYLAFLVGFQKIAVVRTATPDGGREELTAGVPSIIC